MQSSATMALRGMILLVCLAIVPALALLNNNARDRGLAWLKRWLESPSQSTTPVATSLDAPIFRPAVVDHTTESGSHPPARSSAPIGATAPSGNDSGIPPRPFAAQPSTVALNNPLPLQNRQQTAPNGDAVNAAPVTMVSHEADIAAIGQQMATSPSPNTVGAAADAPQFPPDYFRSTELKLRSLGAAYYLLEFGATAANEYRFLCKMPAANNPEETLVFFASNSDPRVAMESVVRQIEGWHGSLQPPVRR